MKAIRTALSTVLCFLMLFGCSPKTENVPKRQEEDPKQEVQAFTGEEPIQPYSASKNAGSARELIGDVLVVSIFMEDPEAQITPQLENEMLEEVRKAADWLENQAKERGKTAKIITGKDDAELKMHYQHPNVITDETGMPYDDILLIMKKLKFGSYYNSLFEKYNTKNVAFILHFNKNGRSNAYPSGALEMWDSELMSSDEANEAEYAYFDICMVYSMMQWEKTVSYAYAHELLHLFGATDLYYTDQYVDERGGNALNMHVEKQTLMDKYCPNEIMHSLNPDLEIGDLTAYLIGWEETVPIKYAYFLYNP